MGLLLNLALILGLLALKAQAQDAAGKDGDSMEATDSTRCIYCKADLDGKNNDLLEVLEVIGKKIRRGVMRERVDNIAWFLNVNLGRHDHYNGKGSVNDISYEDDGENIFDFQKNLMKVLTLTVANEMYGDSEPRFCYILFNNNAAWGCLELCNLSACELVKTVNQELGGQGWMEQMFALSYEKPKVDLPCKLAHHFRNRLEEEMEEDEDEGEDGEGDATGDEEEDNENMLDSGESEGLHMMPFLVTNSNADNSDYGGYCHDNFTTKMALSAVGHHVDDLWQFISDDDYDFHVWNNEQDMMDIVEYFSCLSECYCEDVDPVEEYEECYKTNRRVLSRPLREFDEIASETD